jgi:hypothetical protein
MPLAALPRFRAKTVAAAAAARLRFRALWGFVRVDDPLPRTVHFLCGDSAHDDAQDPAEDPGAAMKFQHAARVMKLDLFVQK